MNSTLKMNKKINFVMRFSSLLVALFIAATSAFAQGSQVLEGVPVSSSVTTKEGQKLQLAGAGLRNKKVLMLNVRVYVGQLFVADLSKFQRNPTEALKSINDAVPVMIQLHFLRDVDAEKIQSSFKDALAANKVDLKKPEVQKFLEAVIRGGEVLKGKALVVLGTKTSEGSEVVTYEDSNSKATTISGGKGFIQDIFSIWLGQPSDEGVAKLKADILKSEPQK